MQCTSEQYPRTEDTEQRRCACDGPKARDTAAQLNVKIGNGMFRPTSAATKSVRMRKGSHSFTSLDTNRVGPVPRITANVGQDSVSEIVFRPRQCGGHPDRRLHPFDLSACRYFEQTQRRRETNAFLIWTSRLGDGAHGRNCRHSRAADEDPTLPSPVLHPGACEAQTVPSEPVPEWMWPASAPAPH